VTTPTIDLIELRVLDPRRSVRWTERASSCHVNTTIISITDSTGAVGVAGVEGFAYAAGDRTTLESVRGMWPLLRGRPVDCGSELVDEVRTGVVFPYVTNGLSLVDMALWDLRAQHADAPLWQLLGGARDKVLAYASLESMPRIDEYLGVVGRAMTEGFRAVKLHAFGDAAKDIELYAVLREAYPDITLMHDAECVYSRNDALRVGLALADMGCPWYEAPLPELDLQAYRELSRQVPVPIMPAGYAIGDYHQVADALLDPPWSACRSEIASTQGITGLLRLMDLAEAAGMNLEPVTYGSAFYAMAGLHVILGRPNATYLELAYPLTEWEYGVTNPLRPDADGFVRAPDAAGLGLELDWGFIESITSYTAAFPG
jgi:L-alanine-DL-glutamate epimerase-like enolase superfamily enzyme